ncbi:MFS transporter [Micromonospora sp. NPDC049559]|uniref:MFS transporter n=1 Tax=Micromonospora sp. NPDC049559 TaxID=3155923 RepID=UPI00342EF945
MRRNRWIALAAVLLSSVSLPVTLTGASVALPDITTDLKANLAAVQWVVTGYNATFASFMLACGSLADLFGRRRVYACGVASFAVTGLLSAAATNIVLLDVLRALAGVGGAAAAASGAALLAASFEGPARARVFGLFGTALGAGLAFGPTVAGVLVDAFGWRAAFGVPAGVAVVVLSLVPALPESRESGRPQVDWAGTVTFSLALLLLIFAFVQGPALGWTSPIVAGAFVASPLLLLVFTVVERRQPRPMFDLTLLASRRFVGFSAAAAIVVCVLIPLLIYLPAYFTNVLGMSAGQAGATLLLLTGPTLVLPLLSGVLARWAPPAAIVVTSVVLVGLGAAWLTVIEPGITRFGLAGPLLTIGAGMGISTGLIDGLAIGSVDARRAGTAAGMFNTARLASETVVIAIFGAVLASLTGGRFFDPGLTEGLRIMLWAMAVLALLTVLLLALLLQKRREPETAAAEPTTVP